MITEGIIIAIITGGMSLVGVIISNIISQRKVEISLEKNQAISDYKLEELTREVRLHNNFATRVPIIEEQLKNLERRTSILETN